MPPASKLIIAVVRATGLLAGDRLQRLQQQQSEDADCRLFVILQWLDSATSGQRHRKSDRTEERTQTGRLIKKRLHLIALSYSPVQRWFPSTWFLKIAARNAGITDLLALFFVDSVVCLWPMTRSFTLQLC